MVTPQKSRCKPCHPTVYCGRFLIIDHCSLLIVLTERESQGKMSIFSWLSVDSLIVGQVVSSYRLCLQLSDIRFTASRWGDVALLRRMVLEQK